MTAGGKMPRINITRIINNIKNFEREIEIYEKMLEARVELNNMRASIPIYGVSGDSKGVVIGETLSQKRTHRIDTYKAQRFILDMRSAIQEETSKYNTARRIWVAWDFKRIELERKASETQRGFSSCLDAIQDINAAMFLIEENRKPLLKQQLEIAKEELAEAQNRAVKAQKQLSSHMLKKPQELPPIEEKLVLKEQRSLTKLIKNSPDDSVLGTIRNATEIRKEDATKRKLQKVANEQAKRTEEELILEEAQITLEDMVIPEHVDTSNMDESEIQLIKQQLLDAAKSKIAKEIIKLKEGAITL